MYFYEKPLQELTDEEWEQICMKCGKCCMCKYSENGFIHFSNQMCHFYDLNKGMCSCYKKRFEMAKDGCKKVSMELLENELELLPPSCAYRRLYEGRGLPKYHPLLTGKKHSVVKAGQTVKSLPVFSENALAKAIEQFIKKACQNHYSEPETMEGIHQLREKFRLKWLETYPYPTKKKPAM